VRRLALEPFPCNNVFSIRSLVTLAVQNSMLTIIMHYSRVSTPPSRMYSAATAVLMNEVLKGSISLLIAFWRIESEKGSTCRPLAVAERVRKLSRDVFSTDCWKLSIPAILYGAGSRLHVSTAWALMVSISQSFKIICNMSQHPTWKQLPSKSAIK